jgi:hypothetical protein
MTILPRSRRIEFTGQVSLNLDDPTAYANDHRTAAVLKVMHHISDERQVIMFGHDAEVLAQAREALNRPRDKLRRSRAGSLPDACLNCLAGGVILLVSRVG